MLRKLLRQNAQLCFHVNTLLPLPQVSGILVAMFRNCVDKELYCAFYVNTLLPNKKMPKLIFIRTVMLRNFLDKVINYAFL